MARPLGRAITAASILLASMVATVGLGGGAPAAAQTDDCLPPPTLIYGEIAQVAGTNSQVWADVQAVEQADEAAGTTASGQVIQDMLTVINRDGYQWDCATEQLEATNVGTIPVSPGIPIIPATAGGAGGSTASTTPAGTSPASTSAGTTPAGATPAGTSATTSAGRGAPPATVSTVANAGLANSSPVGVGQSTNGVPSGQVVAPLALAAGTNSSNSGTGELSTVALGLLALVTAALLVLVVRWQMRRR